MTLEETDLCEMTESVWSTMLSLDVRACETSPAERRAPMTAVVRIGGAWRGAVVVECDGPLAARAAAAMLGVRPTEPTPAQAAEALAEITNQISGNLKALLPEPCEISLPTTPPDGGAARASGRLAAHATFECLGDVFTVTVIEQGG
jgi:CheY-specific phosphatase CheX